MNEPLTLDMADTRDAAGSMSGWLLLIGVVSILSGVIAALSIVGIIIAWVPIWAGILLVQASQRSSRLVSEGNPDHIPTLIRKLKMYFVLQGWLMIISVVITLILVAVGLFLGAPFLEQFQDALNRV
jgi:hypothetical protein